MPTHSIGFDVSLIDGRILTVNQDGCQVGLGQVVVDPDTWRGGIVVGIDLARDRGDNILDVLFDGDGRPTPVGLRDVVATA